MAERGNRQPPHRGRGAGRDERPAARGGKPGERAGRPGGQGAPRPPRGGAPDRQFLYGLHPVHAALLNPDRSCRRLLVTAGALAAIEPILAEAAAKGLARPAPEIVDRSVIESLLPAGAVHQGLALEVKPLPDTALEDILFTTADNPAAVLMVLDQVTDPHNVGAVLRSAAALGATAVVLTERHAPEATAVLAKSASGALDAVPLVRVTNLARAIVQMQEAGFWTVGLDESGPSTLAAMKLKGKTALVLGSEGSGLRRLTMERCDAIARLPTRGPIGSLNVSNAAAVALYELVRERE